MARRQQEDFSFAPLPRESRSSKVRRYLFALTFAAIIAASLLVIASVAGVALAPLFERDDANLLPAPAQAPVASNPPS